MVTATETPNLVPVTPEWMDRHSTSGGVRNINDIYWKRGPKEPNAGWILIGPSAVPDPHTGRPMTTQAESWIRKGRIPLIEYSYTAEVSPATGKRETIETNKDRLNTVWRWYWLFKNGGAHLFPIDQIVTYKWHIEPPYGLDKSVFPQLAEWEVPDPRYCHACAESRPPFNSDKECVTHLMVHHRMTEPQALELLKYASEPPVGAAGLRIRRKAMTEEKRLEAIGYAPVSEPSPEPIVHPSPNQYICNYCGDLFQKKGQLRMHINMPGRCSAKPQPEGESGGQAEQAPVAPEEE